MNGCHIKPEQFFHLIWGYNDQYFERVYNDTASAGTNVLLGTQVPANEIWVVTAVSCYDEDNKPTAIIIGILKGSTYNTFFSDAPAAKAITVAWSGLATMVEDDRVFGILTGCVANDNIALYIHGYKMKPVQ